MKPIWIVDDDQSIRFVLEKALLRENLPTRSFTNATEVLKALSDTPESEGPQILVSDIRMPGGSGLDLLEKVKQRYPALPVIIMTAFSDLDSAVAAFQGGAFEYLPKPFDLPKAVELIRRAVDESVREEVLDDRVTQMPEMLGQARRERRFAGAFWAMKADGAQLHFRAFNQSISPQPDSARNKQYRAAVGQSPLIANSGTASRSTRRSEEHTSELQSH